MVHNQSFSKGNDESRVRIQICLATIQQSNTVLPVNNFHFFDCQLIMINSILCSVLPFFTVCVCVCVISQCVFIVIDADSWFLGTCLRGLWLCMPTFPIFPHHHCWRNLTSAEQAKPWSKMLQCRLFSSITLVVYVSSCPICLYVHWLTEVNTAPMQNVMRWYQCMQLLWLNFTPWKGQIIDTHTHTNCTIIVSICQSSICLFAYYFICLSCSSYIDTIIMKNHTSHLGILAFCVITDILMIFA